MLICISIFGANNFNFLNVLNANRKLWMTVWVTLVIRGNERVLKVLNFCKLSPYIKNLLLSMNVFNKLSVCLVLKL